MTSFSFLRSCCGAVAVLSQVRKSVYACVTVCECVLFLYGCIGLRIGCVTSQSLFYRSQHMLARCSQSSVRVCCEIRLQL